MFQTFLKLKFRKDLDILYIEMIVGILNFEYADYEKIASYFTFPLTFSLLDNPQIIANKKDLITFYKQMRASVQDGYKYSLLDKSRIVWLSKDAYMFDATYSRYNEEYERVFQGRGIYMYKKVDKSWKMFSVSSLPIPKKKVKKTKKKTTTNNKGKQTNRCKSWQIASLFEACFCFFIPPHSPEHVIYSQRRRVGGRYSMVNATGIVLKVGVDAEGHLHGAT